MLNVDMWKIEADDASSLPPEIAQQALSAVLSGQPVYCIGNPSDASVTYVLVTPLDPEQHPFVLAA